MVKRPSTLTQAREELDAEQLASVRTLAWLRDNAKDERLRAHCAERILEHGKGKPKQDTTIELRNAASADRAHIEAMLSIVARVNPLVSLDKSDYHDNLLVNHASPLLPVADSQAIEIVEQSGEAAEGPPASTPAGGSNNNQHPRAKNKRGRK